MNATKKHASLEQLADLFRVLAVAPPEERAMFRRGLTAQDWKDMESITVLAGMLSGLEGEVSLRREALSELFRSMIAFQDRAVETVYVDVAERR